jgi:hypothetical protein
MSTRHAVLHVYKRSDSRVAWSALLPVFQHGIHFLGLPIAKGTRRHNLSSHSAKRAMRGIPPSAIQECRELVLGRQGLSILKERLVAAIAIRNVNLQ